MPDQPADPIHYEMKIPPEPKQKEQPPEAQKSEAEKERSEEKDTSGTRENEAGER
jgi:hypothetical protein